MGRSTFHREGHGTNFDTPSTSERSKLFADDFRGVCQGAAVSRPTAYDAAAAAHKVVLFSSYDGDLIEDTSTLPESSRQLAAT